MAEETIDLSEFEALKPKGRPCVFQHAATVLDRGELRTLHAALDAGYSNRIVAQWLTQRGIPIKQEAIAKHRSGVCNCER